MGLFSGWKQRQRERIRDAAAPYNQARNEIWSREQARLGEQEFQRRMDAIADHELGRAGRSGFEEWQRRLNTDIQARALEIARQQDRRSR